MQRIRLLTVVIVVFLVGCSVKPAVSPTPTSLPQRPSARVEFYTVEHHDTWNRIAARFLKPIDILWIENGITNPSLLAAGLRLIIATRAPEITNLEVLTGSSPNKVPIVQLAVRSNTPEYLVRVLNGIRTVSILDGSNLAVGSIRIGIPEVTGPGPTQVPSVVSTPYPAEGILRADKMGIQGYFELDAVDIDYWLTKATDAGFTWVKYQVNWKTNETPADIYPYLGILDAFFNNAERHHVNVLLSVVKAPEWARNTFELDGPPKEFSEYFSFVRFLANRYKDRLSRMQIAIEIWNEPNTLREWSGAPLSASNYVTLLSGSYVAIKEEDSRYTVVSAGLAPTGVNDGINAVDDRQYFRQMYEAGLARVTDAVGIHPYGWANPVSSRCCNDPMGPPAYNDNPRFFFLNTIEDYRAIQAEFGDADLHDLWITEFGWPSISGISIEAPIESPWSTYVTPDQQAAYLLDAFVLMQDQDYMGPMFVWNLNMSTLASYNSDHAGYSLFLSTGSPRPAYDMFVKTPKR